MSIIYNVCLVPIGDFAERIALYSQNLSTKNHSRFVLGKFSVPHATVLQFSSNETEEQVLKAFRQLRCEKRISVNVAGLALLPTDDGDLWCELAILKSSALQSLQLSVMDGLRSMVSEVKNAVQDNFRPHFTVALNFTPTTETQWSQPFLFFFLLRASNEICELRIGRSGENFQVTYLFE